MKYFDIPEKEFETFCNIALEDLELSVRVYNRLKRGGCETLVDVAYLSVEEMRGLKNLGGSGLREIQEKLEEYHISLMTQEEKQQLLEEMDNLQILKRKVQRLEGLKNKNRERIQDLERERANAWKSEWEKEEENREQGLQEAREIIRTSPYPVTGVLQRMHWGKNTKEGCGFCEIFELRDKNCFVLTDSQMDRSLQFSCEECMETYLADYYWKQKMLAKQKEEREEAPKMMRMSGIGYELIGRCPVCKQKHSYEKDTYYCFRCGTFLNWDEENWDEKTKEYYDLLYCGEEDEMIEE